MSHGLYISDGINGGVITNSDVIFNEEYDFELTSQSIGGNSSINIQTEGAGNSALIGIDLTTSSENIEITRNSSTDTLTITNTNNGNAVFSAKLFRFQ